MRPLPTVGREQEDGLQSSRSGQIKSLWIIDQIEVQEAGSGMDGVPTSFSNSTDTDRSCEWAGQSGEYRASSLSFALLRKRERRGEGGAWPSLASMTLRQCMG